MDGSHTDGDEQSMEVQANWGGKVLGKCGVPEGKRGLFQSRGDAPQWLLKKK